MAKLYTITFKRRYRGYLQQGNGLHSGKCPSPELSPGGSTIDAEFPDDIDPAKAPELADA